MTKQDEIQRSQAKTREQRFLNMMQQEFNYSPKMAQAILAEAQDCLLGQPGNLKPGQMRVILLQRQAAHGSSLRETPTKEVTWTVDNGQEDSQVAMQHGRVNLRQVRLQRLLSEAVEQGAVAVSRNEGPLVFTGALLAGIAAQRFDDPDVLRAANRLMREVIAFHLGGKELKSRKVLLEMRRK